MAPRRRSVSIWYRPAKNRVEPNPLGVVGVVSPWNFPLHLALIPAATALAAGNRVMLKVSEFTPHTSAVLKRLIEENFSPDVFYVTDGGGEVASAFTKLPFDHLLFTGSTQVGKIVAKAAADNLTPVTLELGGKSPVIVDEDYPIGAPQPRWRGRSSTTAVRSASRRTTSWCRAGARRSSRSPRGRQLASSIRRPPETPSTPRSSTSGTTTGSPPTSPKRRHLDAEVISVEDPELGRSRRQLPLTMIINPPVDSTVMTDEIFGPVLPIIGYDTDQAAEDFVNSRSTPLALYVLSTVKQRQKHWLTRVASGSAVVNDMMVGYLQNDLPFGGRGGSGYGAYHGREGFDTMSHLRPGHVPASHLRTHRRPDALPAVRARSPTCCSS